MVAQGSARAIDFYFDFSSPYGYLASYRIDEIAADFGRTVTWRPYLLGVAFKNTGQSPLVSQPIRGVYALRDMERTARKQKVPLVLPEGFPMATMAAGRAFYWLDGSDPRRAVDLAKALYRAAFAQGRNITPTDVVAAVAGEIGLDPAEVAAAIGSPEAKERLRAETEAAIARGAFGSPFVIVDGEPFWGNDRLDEVRDWLETGGW
jgi:2-hydroxychromene-2-carboxylate isomerase